MRIIIKTKTVFFLIEFYLMRKKILIKLLARITNHCSRRIRTDKASIA